MATALTIVDEVAGGRPALVSVAGRSRVSFAGVLVDRDDRSTIRRRLWQFLRSGGTHQIVTVNLDFLAIAARDEAFRDAINDSDLAVADGMPLVWLSKLKGRAIPARVTGLDLVEESCRLAVADGRGVFLLGAAPGIAAAAAVELRRRYPAIRIAGAYSPPFRPLSPLEERELVLRIRAAAPAFLFVAYGAPRQDLWIRARIAELGVPVSIGVGCTLDLLAGSFCRAPRWMQASGLEWCYRLAQEPKRLWKRYLVNDLSTLARLVFCDRAR